LGWNRSLKDMLILLRYFFTHTHTHTHTHKQTTVRLLRSTFTPAALTGMVVSYSVVPGDEHAEAVLLLLVLVLLL
jgi:hypothetical protein